MPTSRPPESAVHRVILSEAKEPYPNGWSPRFAQGDSLRGFATHSEPARGPRIASLLPGATEIALALGLGESLVAVSHSCDFPGRVARLPRVTRTRIPKEAPSREIDRIVRDGLARGESLYEVDAERLDELAPDLILTQGICQVCAVGPGEVARAKPTVRSAPDVLSLEPNTLDETFAAILEVGRVAGCTGRARRVVAALGRRVSAVRRRYRRTRRPRVAFLEWLDPPICGGHWNPELVELAGGEDGLGRPGEPSRTVTWDEVRAWEPEVLVAACCGYSAERTRAELRVVHAELAGTPCVRSGRVYVADGVELFSRPGPGLVASLEVLGTLLGA
jgi:iron complex transport system substrate-binding protein